MPHPKLIGITGYARHGKGSVAEILKRDYGYTVLSFAEPDKQFLLALNPLVQTSEHEQKTKFSGETPFHFGVRLSVLVAQYGSLNAVKEHYPDVRTLLQRIGTDAAKPIFGNDCWAEIGIEKAYKIIAEGGKVCFDDLRFPVEEGEAILAHKILSSGRFGHWSDVRISPRIWRVTRIDKDGKSFDNKIGTDHPSESQVKNFVPDEEILNDGSLDDLARKVEEILK